jgi:hypothetical protein
VKPLSHGESAFVIVGHDRLSVGRAKAVAIPFANAKKLLGLGNSGLGNIPRSIPEFLKDFIHRLDIALSGVKHDAPPRNLSLAAKTVC